MKDHSPEQPGSFPLVLGIRGLVNATIQFFAFRSFHSHVQEAL